jgi:hypothetical protein
MDLKFNLNIVKLVVLIDHQELVIVDNVIIVLKYWIIIVFGLIIV